MTHAFAPPPSDTTKLDFSRREFALPELMDEPCTFADWEQTLKDLAQVNRLLGGNRSVFAFLDRILRERGVRLAPLHIVDVGCGDGELLRSIHRWAARRSVPVRLTGFDNNSYSARAAQARDREQSIPAGVIRWMTADVFTADIQDADVILSSLFTHHLSEPDIVHFLRWQDARAQCGWLINDLRRSERSYRWFDRLARLMRWHRFVQHDGPVSIRRAFSEEDWQRMLQEAAVHGANTVDAGRGRLCVEKFSPRPLPNP